MLSQEDGLAVVLIRIACKRCGPLRCDHGEHLAAARREPTTVAVTGEIDKVRYSAGEGSCLDAAKSSDVIRVTVLQLGER